MSICGRIITLARVLSVPGLCIGLRCRLDGDVWHSLADMYLACLWRTGLVLEEVDVCPACSGMLRTVIRCIMLPWMVQSLEHGLDHN